MAMYFGGFLLVGQINVINQDTIDLIMTDIQGIRYSIMVMPDPDQGLLSRDAYPESSVSF